MRIKNFSIEFMKSVNLNNYILDKNPEKSLWKAVLLQAFVDLQNNSKKKIANTYRIKSLFWFNIKNKEFLDVCGYAGLDPNYVLSKAKKIKDIKFNKIANDNNKL